MNRTKYLKGECSHCGGHIEFPAEAAGLTTECPHCGQTTELLLATPPQESTVPTRAIVWTASSVLILGLGLGGALYALKRAEKWAARQKEQAAARRPPVAVTNRDTPSAPQAEDPATKAGFKVSAIRLEKTPGTSVVHAVGRLTNATDRQRFGVTVELDLFDADGKKLGTATDYQAVLEPKGQWQFRALVVDAKATSAKLAGIKEDK